MFTFWKIIKSNGINIHSVIFAIHLGYFWRKHGIDYKFKPRLHFIAILERLKSHLVEQRERGRKGEEQFLSPPKEEENPDLLHFEVNWCLTLNFEDIDQNPHEVQIVWDSQRYWPTLFHFPVVPWWKFYKVIFVVCFFASFLLLFYYSIQFCSLFLFFFLKKKKIVKKDYFANKIKMSIVQSSHCWN